MADPALDMLEDFRLRRMARIQECLDNHEEEGQYIEFKELSNDAGKVDDTVKRTLAKNISGFANGGGGILVWGIKAKDDLATDGIPIPNLSEFRRKLEEVTSQIIVPPLGGVVHLAIPDSEGSDAGYVVTYVPDGEVKPHRSMAKDQHVYFLRSNASTETMADAAVRAFVIAGARPSLMLKAELGEVKAIKGGIFGAERAKVPPESVHGLLRFSVVNDGTALAESPAVAIEDNGRYVLANLRDTSDSTIDFEGVSHAVKLYRMSYADPIYPGTTLRHGHVEFYLQVEQFEDGYRPAEDFTLRYWVFARNFSETKLIVIPKESLIIG